MVFESLLHPIFSPLLSLHPLAGIFIISLIISIGITLIYKYTTDQNLMKQLKAEIKAFQKQTKELKEHPEEAMKVQKKAMETNMKYMMQSMKPTLFTMLPIIIIFGWLNAHMAFHPLVPGQEFSATVAFDEGVKGEIELITDLLITGESVKEIDDGQVVFTVKGMEKGEYLLEFVRGGQSHTKEVIISSEWEYAPVEEAVKKDGIRTITLSNAPVKPFGNLSIFGWHPGWLGAYIIFSIVLSSLLRKLMKIY